MKAGVRQTGGDARRGRVIFWVVLLLGAVVVLALSLHFRSNAPATSEDNPAFSLDFPGDFEKASSLRNTFAITGPEGATVIFNPHRNSPPLKLSDAKQQLHRLSCKAKPKLKRSAGQTVITTVAPRPCQLFESAAMVFGPTHRVSVACSAKTHDRAVDTCRETLAGLQVK